MIIKRDLFFFLDVYMKGGKIGWNLMATTVRAMNNLLILRLVGKEIKFLDKFVDTRRKNLWYFLFNFFRFGTMCIEFIIGLEVLNSNP